MKDKIITERTVLLVKVCASLLNSPGAERQLKTFRPLHALLLPLFLSPKLPLPTHFSCDTLFCYSFPTGQAQFLVLTLFFPASASSLLASQNRLVPLLPPP